MLDLPPLEPDTWEQRFNRRVGFLMMWYGWSYEEIMDMSMSFTAQAVRIACLGPNGLNDISRVDKDSKVE